MANRWLCGARAGCCNGGKIMLNKSDAKAHSSPGEAFRCMKNYLVNELGYEQIGQREFVRPQDGYVEVLTKKSRFGTRVVTGKSAEGMSGKRFTFRRHRGGSIGDGVSA